PRLPARGAGSDRPRARALQRLLLRGGDGLPGVEAGLPPVRGPHLLRGALPDLLQDDEGRRLGGDLADAAAASDGSAPQAAPGPRGGSREGMTAGSERVLVLGGTGFLGSHLVERLARAGTPVRVVSARARWPWGALPPGVESTRFD